MVKKKSVRARIARNQRTARERLRALREANNLSQMQLSKLLTTDDVNVPQSMICQLETGERKRPSIEVAFRIEEIAESHLGGKLPAKSWLALEE